MNHIDIIVEGFEEEEDDDDEYVSMSSSELYYDSFSRFAPASAAAAALGCEIDDDDRNLRMVAVEELPDDDDHRCRESPTSTKSEPEGDACRRFMSGVGKNCETDDVDDVSGGDLLTAAGDLRQDDLEFSPTEKPATAGGYAGESVTPEAEAAADHDLGCSESNMGGGGGGGTNTTEEESRSSSTELSGANDGVDNDGGRFSGIHAAAGDEDANYPAVAAAAEDDDSLAVVLLTPIFSPTTAAAAGCEIEMEMEIGEEAAAAAEFEDATAAAIRRQPPPPSDGARRPRAARALSSLQTTSRRSRHTAYFPTTATTNIIPFSSTVAAAAAAPPIFPPKCQPSSAFHDELGWPLGLTAITGPFFMSSRSSSCHASSSAAAPPPPPPLPPPRGFSWLHKALSSSATPSKPSISAIRINSRSPSRNRIPEDV